MAVAFFGDGATNQGYFHECLNFAQVLRLPVVFVCENNFYGEFTPMHQVTAGAAISARGAAYGIPARVVDGNDLLAVEQAAVEAVAVARSGGGPSLLECQTYRHYGHSKSDPATYRPKGELESWLERDPLIVTRARLVEAGVDGRAARRGRRAGEGGHEHGRAEAALAAPYPDPDEGARHGVRAVSDSAQLEFRAAIRDALAEEIERDPDVVFFGEDVAAAGGVFKATPELHERFGDERVFDTPISELALAGAAFGAAVTGLRPVFEVMFGDFMALPMDSLVNQAAKFWYISNEQGPVPLVVRSAVGGGGRFGAIHSQFHATWFQGVPGLKIAAPSNPADAKGLLKAAIRDDNPVIFLEHKRLYSVKGPAPQNGDVVPLGEANVVREGSDLTIVSIAKGVPDSLAAAEQLAADGIDAEVIDLRTLRPLDLETVLRSVEKTNRVVAVEEGPRLGGWAANLVGAVAGRGAARPRRRLGDRDRRDADPLQPAARGRVHPDAGLDRRRRARARLARGLVSEPWRASRWSPAPTAASASSWCVSWRSAGSRPCSARATRRRGARRPKAWPPGASRSRRGGSTSTTPTASGSLPRGSRASMGASTSS